MNTRAVYQTPRMLLVLTILCLLLAYSSNSLALSIISNFDVSSEGWTVNTDQGSLQGTLAYFSSGGNSGGHIRITDASFQAVDFGFGVIAPTNFLGNLLPFNEGSISFDSRAFNLPSRTSFSTFGKIIITGAGMTAQFDVATPPPPLGAWQKYTAPLAAATWGVTDSNWISILGNVNSILIGLEAYSGADIIGFDSFAISSHTAPPDPIPEPGTFVLVGSGLMAFAWNRKMVLGRLRDSRKVRSILEKANKALQRTA